MRLSGDSLDPPGPGSAPSVDPEAVHRQGVTAGLSQQTLRNSLWTVAGTVVAGLLSAASTIVIARALQTTPFGRYNFVLYALTLALSLSEIGVNSRGLTVLVRAWPAGDLATFAAELRFLIKFAGLRAAAVAVIAFALLRGTPVLACVLAASLAVQSASAPLSIAMVAQSRFRALNIAATSVAILQGVSTSWVAIASHNADWTAAAFFASQLLNVVVVVALAPWAVLRGHAHKRKPAGARTQIAFYIYGICSLIIFGKSETFVLSVSHQAVALGLFAVATTLAARATLLTDALYGALVPALGEAANRDSEAMGRAYSTSLRFSSSLVLLTGVLAGPLFTVVGPIVLSTHGSSVRIAVAVTLGGSLVQTFVFPLVSIAKVESQGRAIALPAAVGAVADISMAIALVPHFGLLGAATASLFGATVFVCILISVIRLPAAAARTLRQQLLRVTGMAGALILGGIATSHLPIAEALGADLLVAVAAYMLCGRVDGVLIESDLAKITTLLARTPLRNIKRGNRLARVLLRVAVPRA